MSQLTISNLNKSYGSRKVLKGIDLEIEKGEIISFIGASGGGKSTLIRCINLLEDFEEGHIVFNGKDIKDKDFNINQYRQKVGMIFQRFNLFSNMNVLENLNIGQIKVLNRSKEEASKISRDMLKKVGLEDFENSRVDNLSGGQMQRVAIARSLSMNPEILLLDEPTSALDPQMVSEVLEVIKEIAKTGLTMIIVTHEMNFAKEISDKIVFLKDGLINEIGTPEDLYNNKNNMDLRQFLGLEARR